MIQFYAADIQDSLTMGPEESSHCIRVLRKKTGDKIFVTDGKGNRFECVITDPSPKRVGLEIISHQEIKRGWTYRIGLAISPTKNVDRISWVVEKAVEVGIDEIVFIKCCRSERKTVNIERLRRVAVSAMNQSLKCMLPTLRDMVSLEAFAKECGYSQKLVGYCNENEPRRWFADCFDPHSDVMICIGPEGDFSPEEIDTMKRNDFIPVLFGKERLRTETAALYGICGAHVLYDKEGL